MLEKKSPRFPGRRQWENESEPLIPNTEIRELFIRERERYGPGYVQEIAWRCGWKRRKCKGSDVIQGDVSPLLRSLGMKVQKNGELSVMMKESTAKRITSAMGYDPVDCGF